MERWHLIIILLIGVAFTLSQQITPQTPGPVLNWVIVSNPSPGDDGAYGICYGEKHIYVVGYDTTNGNAQWRIEMREKDTGKLVKIWTQNPSKGMDVLRDCVVVGDRLYVVGSDEVLGNSQWAILMFDLNLSLLKIVKSNPSEGWDGPKTIITDGEYLYIAGYSNASSLWWGFLSQWYLEKRSLNLSLVKTYFPKVEGVITEVAINPVTGHLWVVGWYGEIHILDRNLNKIEDLYAYVSFPFGITFDNEGNTYVYEYRAIVKFDKTGKFLRRSLTGRYQVLFSSEFIGSRLYSIELNFTEALDVMLTTRDKKYLNYLNDTITVFRKVIYVEISKWKAVFDGYSLYVAGMVENGTGGYMWLVFSVSVPVSVRVLSVDGFNNTRQWPVEIVNTTGAVVSSGNGSVVAELLSGRKYTAVVRALGTEIRSDFVARDGLELKVVVPTAKVSVRAVDGFGRSRDWPLELVGIAQGNGSLGPLEVLGNRTYTARVRAFGRWFNTTFYVGVGKVVNISASVPTAFLTVRAVDGFGKVRDWPVEIVGVSRGVGLLGPLEVVAGVYVAKVAAFGSEFNKTVEVRAGQNATVAVEVPTALLSAKVVDGYGEQRDWLVEIVGVASGRGFVGPVEVLGGRQYVARASAFGKNFTKVIHLAAGANATVVVKVPTTRVTVRAVDGFGKARDWPVEIVGVASGSGVVGPVEVLAGQYEARAKAFGREFAEMFTAEAGKTVEKAVRVPTALISVVVLDDDKKRLDSYVEFVTVDGETYPKPPRELEVLAGRYFIRARALGKEASAEVELSPGEVREVEVVIPGTAGFDVGGMRITYTTAAVLAAVLLATAAGVALYALRRRKH